MKDLIRLFVIIIFVALMGSFLHFVSLYFNPAWLLLILLVIPFWILFYVITNFLKMRYNLIRYGFYGGSFKAGYCIYEEYHDKNLRILKLKLKNTSHGHWELFVPTESEWKLTVPDWAENRRIEVVERIKKFYKESHIHLPDDYP